MVWAYQAKTASGVAEVDFVFSDAADFVFSDASDFVFVEGTEATTYTYPSKSSTSYNYATKN